MLLREGPGHVGGHRSQPRRALCCRGAGGVGWLPPELERLRHRSHFRRLIRLFLGLNLATFESDRGLPPSSNCDLRRTSQQLWNPCSFK